MMENSYLLTQNEQDKSLHRNAEKNIWLGGCFRK